MREIPVIKQSWSHKLNHPSWPSLALLTANKAVLTFWNLLTSHTVTELRDLISISKRSQYFINEISTLIIFNWQKLVHNNGIHFNTIYIWTQQNRTLCSKPGGEKLELRSSNVNLSPVMFSPGDDQELQKIVPLHYITLHYISSDGQFGVVRNSLCFCCCLKSSQPPDWMLELPRCRLGL